jgi:predicted GNAT family N-acyltransferase
MAEHSSPAFLINGLILGAQLTVREFYKRLGYVEEGSVFDDAAIAHVMMRRKL